MRTAINTSMHNKTPLYKLVVIVKMPDKIRAFTMINPPSYCYASSLWGTNRIHAVNWSSNSWPGTTTLSLVKWPISIRSPSSFGWICLILLTTASSSASEILEKVMLCGIPSSSNHLYRVDRLLPSISAILVQEKCNCLRTLFLQLEQQSLVYRYCEK